MCKITKKKPFNNHYLTKCYIFALFLGELIYLHYICVVIVDK